MRTRSRLAAASLGVVWLVGSTAAAQDGGVPDGVPAEAAPEGAAERTPAWEQPESSGETGATGAAATAAASEAAASPTATASDTTTTAASSASSSDASAGAAAMLGGSIEESTGVPLSFGLRGTFRVRANWIGNVPSRVGLAWESDEAAYVSQRLRLQPFVRYGSDPDAPIATLHMTIDALDNVVWGDNSRLARTPIFATEPTYVNFEGFEGNAVRLERAWLELLIPVGQIRVGRMPFQWGLGILATNDDGLGEWGDPQYGSTVDRLLFATRPISVYKALAQGDARPTPLIFAVGYDGLVEDPLTDPSDPFGDPLDGSVRTAVPFGYLLNGAESVHQAIFALIWNDPDVNPARDADELTAGGFFIHRWQPSTASSVFIGNLYTKLRYALGPRLPSLTVQGEGVTIQGTSEGIILGGNCDTAVPLGGFAQCDQVRASLWGGVLRAGVIDRNEAWAANLEIGFNSGDPNLGQSPDPDLTARSFHSDYRVGLLLYPVALQAMTAAGFGEALRPLWSRGGVWNSSYLWPQARYEFLPGWEVHGAVVLAWAQELTPAVYVNNRPDGTRGCGMFGSDCLIGFEGDLAIRAKWGENDLFWWDTEGGIAVLGDAMHQTVGGAVYGLSADVLWTIQTRIAMNW